MIEPVKNKLKEFRRIYETRHQLLGELKEKNQEKICGTFCSYFPAEIIHAAGMLPVRILGDQRKVVNTEKYLPSFGCSFIRGSLEAALSSTLDYLDAVVFSHTCDSIQVLSDVWGNLSEDKFVANLVFPTHLDGSLSYQYLVEELKSFKKKLEHYLGDQIKEEALWESIRIYQENRHLLSQVYQWRAKKPGLLLQTDILNIVISGMILPKQEHNQLLAELVPLLQEEETELQQMRRPVNAVLAGNICVFPDIIDIIESGGVTIVDDDLCTGRRYFTNELQDTISEKESDPLAYLATSYLSKLPCPSKHSNKVQRERILLDMVEQNGADGVIFLVLRLCDPFSYDYTGLKKALEKKGVPNVTIEYEHQTESFQQIQTRVEAFVETVRSEYQ